MDLDKDVFTTFETADICNANITSIKNWIDRGELDAFQTPGGHHRIEREVLEAFLNRHGMPNPFLKREQHRILVVHQDASLVDRLSERIGAKHHYEVTCDPVDAMLRIGQWRPDAAVIDAGIDALDVAGLCERVREHDDLAGVSIVVVESESQPGRSWTDVGADAVVADGDPGGLMDAVARVVGVE